MPEPRRHTDNRVARRNNVVHDVARALGVASEQSRIARKEWFIVAIVTVVAVALDGVVSARSDFIHATGA